jgi:hypothetical protein
VDSSGSQISIRLLGRCNIIQTTVHPKMSVFWDITLCNPVSISTRLLLVRCTSHGEPMEADLLVCRYLPNIWGRCHFHVQFTLVVAYFRLISCFVYSSTLKMEAISSYETSVDIHQTIWRYIHRRYNSLFPILRIWIQRQISRGFKFTYIYGTVASRHVTRTGLIAYFEGYCLLSSDRHIVWWNQKAAGQ